MPRLPTNLTMYEDVRVILERALQCGGGTYRLPSHSAAVRWRHRAYLYRRLLQQIAAESFIGTGLPPTTPFDQMILRVTKGSTEVEIAFRLPTGEFIPAAVEGAKPPRLPEDEAAQEFLAELRSKQKDPN